MNPLTNRLLGIYPAIYRCNHCSSLIEVSKEDIKTMNKESITSEIIPGGLTYKATEIQIKNYVIMSILFVLSVIQNQ